MFALLPPYREGQGTYGPSPAATPLAPEISIVAQNQVDVQQVENLLDTPELAEALESKQFRRFLDKIPIAIGVADLSGKERIVYINPEFEQVCAISAAKIKGRSWEVVPGKNHTEQAGSPLSSAVVEATDYIGRFCIDRPGQDPSIVDAYSNIIEDDSGKAAFRIVALVGVRSSDQGLSKELEQQLQQKDLLLREIQHRVKNNLQMITALIRLEARNAQGNLVTPFNRLAGRIESLALLYETLSNDQEDKELDLGIYLSQLAAAVLKSHGREGIRLDLKVDAYPVSVNVAMPTGLVVNELLTNALKHAFNGRNTGTITLHSLVDGNGCKIIVADDGVGLPPGVEWPRPGKLSALIVESLQENARATLAVKSTLGKGTEVTIHFTRSAAAPEG